MTPEPDDGRRPGAPTEAAVFYGIAAFCAVIGAVYGVSTTLVDGFEAAGTLALAGVAVFAALFGAFLHRALRRIQLDVEALEAAHAAGDAGADDILYLPTVSIWPAGIALGLSLVLAGVPLGLWVMLPGGAILVHSLLGFARQSRTRS